MRRRLAVGACLAILVTAAWSIRSHAQAPPQGHGRPPIGALTTVASPCVGNPNSTECMIDRLNRIDGRLDAVEKSINELQSRAVRAVPSGPPISGISEPGGKTDVVDTEYLQKRIDAIAKVVTDLVNRVNAR